MFLHPKPWKSFCLELLIPASTGVMNTQARKRWITSAGNANWTEQCTDTLFADQSRSHTEKRSHSLAHKSIPRPGGNAVLWKVKSSVLQKERAFTLWSWRKSWVSSPKQTNNNKKKSPWLKRRHDQGWRSDLLAGQNRKLAPENRIKEEKATVMLVHCSYFLCEAPEEKCCWWPILGCLSISRGYTGFSE